MRPRGLSFCNIISVTTDFLWCNVEKNYPKALKTELRRPEDRRQSVVFLMPYEGNLTDKKFADLAGKVLGSIKAIGYSGATVDQVTERLKSDWFTGRVKDVTLRRCQRGTVSLFGPGWGCMGLAPSDVIVE